jgi:uncharacterized protein
VQLWVDNDGCPRLVVEIAFKAAERRRFPVTVVANRYSKVPPGGLVKMVVVSGAFDAADNHIADNCAAGDLVITGDVPLAARVVAKGATALNPRGEIYDASSIQERLAMRNLMQELRSGGEIQGGPAPLGEGDKKRFADAFDRLVTKLLVP